MAVIHRTRRTNIRQRWFPDDVYKKGLLHAASHVWIYRVNEGDLEILLQKRAANKRTWPNRYDISAAGHIDLDESPIQAAIREVKEEISINIEYSDLKLINVYRIQMQPSKVDYENEFQWIYILELKGKTNYEMQESEVQSLEWMTINEFETRYISDDFVPHSGNYYKILIENLKRQNSSR